MTPSNVYWGDWRHNSPPGGASNWRPLPTLWAQVHLAHRLQFADPLSTAAAARPNSVRARFALPASASQRAETGDSAREKVASVHGFVSKQRSPALAGLLKCRLEPYGS
jgi:hypothetical protein